MSKCATIWSHWRENRWTTSSIFFLLSFIRCVFLTLVTVATLCTIFDVKSRKIGKRSEFDRAFSLFSNCTSLFSLDRSSKDIKCLHGLRVLSILGIIFLHTVVFRSLNPNLNYGEFEDFLKTNLASIISSFNIFVDTFFVISAALTARSILKDLDK